MHLNRDAQGLLPSSRLTVAKSRKATKLVRFRPENRKGKSREGPLIRRGSSPYTTFGDGDNASPPSTEHVHKYNPDLNTRKTRTNATLHRGKPNQPDEQVVPNSESTNNRPFR